MGKASEPSILRAVASQEAANPAPEASESSVSAHGQGPGGGSAPNQNPTSTLQAQAQAQMPTTHPHVASGQEPITGVSQAVAPHVPLLTNAVSALASSTLMASVDASSAYARSGGQEEFGALATFLPAAITSLRQAEANGAAGNNAQAMLCLQQSLQALTAAFSTLTAPFLPPAPTYTAPFGLVAGVNSSQYPSMYGYGGASEKTDVSSQLTQAQGQVPTTENEKQGVVVIGVEVEGEGVKVTEKYEGNGGERRRKEGEEGGTKGSVKVEMGKEEGVGVISCLEECVVGSVILPLKVHGEKGGGGAVNKEQENLTEVGVNVGGREGLTIEGGMKEKEEGLHGDNGESQVWNRENTRGKVGGGEICDATGREGEVESGGHERSTSEAEAVSDLHGERECGSVASLCTCENVPAKTTENTKVEGDYLGELLSNMKTDSQSTTEEDNPIEKERSEGGEFQNDAVKSGSPYASWKFGTVQLEGVAGETLRGCEDGTNECSVKSNTENGSEETSAEAASEEIGSLRLPPDLNPVKIERKRRADEMETGLRDGSSDVIRDGRGEDGEGRDAFALGESGSEEDVQTAILHPSKAKGTNSDPTLSHLATPQPVVWMHRAESATTTPAPTKTQQQDLKAELSLDNVFPLARHPLSDPQPYLEQSRGGFGKEGHQADSKTVVEEGRGNSVVVELGKKVTVLEGKEGIQEEERESTGGKANGGMTTQHPTHTMVNGGYGEGELEPVQPLCGVLAGSSVESTPPPRKIHGNLSPSKDELKPTTSSKFKKENEEPKETPWPPALASGCENSSQNEGVVPTPLTPPFRATYPLSSPFDLGFSPWKMGPAANDNIGPPPGFSPIRPTTRSPPKHEYSRTVKPGPLWVGRSLSFHGEDMETCGVSALLSPPHPNSTDSFGEYHSQTSENSRFSSMWHQPDIYTTHTPSYVRMPVGEHVPLWLQVTPEVRDETAAKNPLSGHHAFTEIPLTPISPTLFSPPTSFTTSLSSAPTPTLLTPISAIFPSLSPLGPVRLPPGFETPTTITTADSPFSESRSSNTTGTIAPCNEISTNSTTGEESINDNHHHFDHSPSISPYAVTNAPLVPLPITTPITTVISKPTTLPTTPTPTTSNLPETTPTDNQQNPVSVSVRHHPVSSPNPATTTKAPATPPPTTTTNTQEANSNPETNPLPHLLTSENTTAAANSTLTPTTTTNTPPMSFTSPITTTKSEGVKANNTDPQVMVRSLASLAGISSDMARAVFTAKEFKPLSAPATTVNLQQNPGNSVTIPPTTTTNSDGNPPGPSLYQNSSVTILKSESNPATITPIRRHGLPRTRTPNHPLRLSSANNENSSIGSPSENSENDQLDSGNPTSSSTPTVTAPHNYTPDPPTGTPSAHMHQATVFPTPIPTPIPYFTPPPPPQPPPPPPQPFMVHPVFVPGAYHHPISPIPPPMPVTPPLPLSIMTMLTADRVPWPEIYVSRVQEIMQYCGCVSTQATQVRPGDPYVRVGGMFTQTADAQAALVEITRMAFRERAGDWNVNLSMVPVAGSSPM